MSAHVVVIGAGASGTIQALHLLREGIARVTLVEKGERQGRGVAYGTSRPEHLLNVTASRMAIYPDDAGHFARWYGERGGEAADYAPRRLFGDYLCELLDLAGDRLRIVTGEAVAIRDFGPLEVRLSDGSRIAADAAVLALGNLRPAPLPGIDPKALGELYVEDPWFGDVADGLGSRDLVLLIGTGLTAIDASLTLDAEGFAGTILGLSRRGLAPRPHLKREPVTDSKPALTTEASALLRAIRRRSDTIGWREAVHELRPLTQDLWREAPIEVRRRFIRHLRPWWDVHRHRIAPPVAERIEAMASQGRLRFAAGRIVSASRDGDRANVTWRPRGSDEAETFVAARIVNCTGPDLDIARCGEPLLDSLLGEGQIRADDCRLGIDVDGESRVLDREGRSSEALSAIGPMTRGAFWEAVAVPDIAVQAQAVARRLTSSLSA